MPQLEDEIDRLYQLPLTDFVQARAALAKRAGAEARKITAQQKPNLAAWAVNQLYWRRRKAYERLVAAADRARTALTQSLAGRGGDTASADAAHEQAVNLAAGETRDILTAAGTAGSPTTLRSIRDTLLALPSNERPGRLVRPLVPLAFEGLTSVLGRAVRLSKRAAPVLPFGRAGTSGRQSLQVATPSAATRAREKQLALARKRELAKLETDRREARTAAHRAETALAGARQRHAKAERRLRRLQAEAEAVAAEVQRAASDVHRLERASKDAATAREQLDYRSSLLTPTDG